ncbi:universal stress protein UspE [Echinimonas agarilytica]|uniref:Universal stress protein UspE n=1 Tax=Echinimonas agarilytica TaxID=1215918 RepID=A0AA41WBW0_9GAMM|nr:universal stress protein UspE [Echinimonas agarilytica]MCM2681194.1 universal stress protein UspE [Echinimonas agarilytica]
MNKYKRLLVVIDPTTDHQPALTRAVHLASKTGAEIHALMCIYDFSYEMTTMLSVQEREVMREAVISSRSEWLENVLEAHKVPVTATTHVEWHNRPFEAVIRYGLEHSMNLIIKATRSHDSLKSVIFTPTDWHLLRKAPMPVLLVKEHEWPEHGNVIAAIDAGNDDDSHKGLNQEIISKAQSVAALVQAEVHLVNSFPGTPLNIAVEIPDFDPDSYTEAVEKYHTTQVDLLGEEFGIAKTNRHVKEGLPEDVIPSIARNVDAELVVMGTIGRTGISAALIGNTAEHVIDQLNCDVLAIKPTEFDCPIAID